MAFTEDLDLIIEHSSHTTIAIKISEIFQFKGLSVDVGKRGSLWVLPVKGNKSMKMSTQIYQWCGNYQYPPWTLRNSENI